jgi:hypothetical protein
MCAWDRTASSKVRYRLSCGVGHVLLSLCTHRYTSGVLYEVVAVQQALVLHPSCICDCVRKLKLTFPKEIMEQEGVSITECSEPKGLKREGVN